jgi:hypothetical protein
MAVYEGARPRTILLPPRPIRTEAPALPRRRVRGAVRAGRRPSWIGGVLVGIVVVFVMAFFSLTQSVRVAATSYDIDRLNVERNQLESEIRDLRSDLNRLGKAPAVRKLGLDAGLDQLPEPLIVIAR